ncbi:MAG: 23S rRNA (guanine(2445)-N(2))-methyltransferase [uncultured Gemmatimonadetes bacterium]|uniref:23S rRNA (Guanine(2445)-N(2))-methyltransferase n=1 Tax=uncultured Gemmatimonadota bacterium TaxID=203437 RepID=A0A6J4MUY0_9BACT|nr:MAG: 23S rRNA (guanine(2445)-N(2))-methyltransferase [uncultured Gemmatimonadota bacterium]
MAHTETQRHGERLAVFAATAPGLEPLAAAELRALGIQAAPEPGGVAWSGTAEELYTANLWLRTASRVTVGAAEFRARTFFELERHARKIPWERWVSKGRAVRLRVTSRKSKLYHEGAIAERVLDAIERRVGSLAGAEVAADDEGDEDASDAQLFVVRFVRDACIVRADSSGALLHLRGYRQAVARAPLRETLAAAALLGSRWPGDAPLLDPMCGSGTIPIEAALMARGIAPGLAAADREPRRFAFQEWPDTDLDAWKRVVERARNAIRPAAPAPILGSDRDAGAIEAASANAERAGVLGDLALTVAPVSAIEPPAGRGWMVSNPPYGVRVGETDALRNLYAALGHTARERAPGWTLALLSAEARLDAQVGVPFADAFQTRNGGIPVHLAVGTV